MTKSEIRAQKERVERAFRFIQRRLNTHLDLTVQVDREISLMSISPSERGVEDPLCFIVEFNPDLVSAMTLREVRSSALHEVIHAVLWPFWEAATAHLKDEVRDHILKRYWEPATYNLERALAPYVVG